MSYNKLDFMADIEKCIEIAYLELYERNNGIQGESTINQLQNFVIPDLTKLLTKLKNEDALPPNNPTERYVESFANAFMAWSWDMHNPTELYQKLVKLNENYRKI